MALPTFQLVPTATNAAAAFCFGQGFKKGDVPAGSSVTAPFSDFQCTPKNAWPDGSLKFAILAGRASVTGTTALVSQLSVGAAATGTAIAASSISAVATVDCGTFGAVTWSGTDWATPFQTTVSGPKMSEFRYRKQVGTDAHLVVWLEVRVWSGGELEVLPIIENGYFFVAAPTNKSATYSFTLGGTQRCSVAIDLKHHQRTPLINGSELAYWLGADPGVTPVPDSVYLQITELVPTYGAVVPSSAGALTAQPTTYVPLQQGRFNYAGDSMPQSGYQSPIGLLPEHDVLYFTAPAASRAAVYKSVVRNGFSAGRYGIHYRDETTQRPPAFSTYPEAGFIDNSGLKDTGAFNQPTPSATGGNAPTYDTAHSPSMGYLAYLLTGRFYFMEEVQFQATANHFNVTGWVRGAGRNGNGYVPATGYTLSSGIWTSQIQTRTGAWGLRTLAQALCVTPDSGNPLRAEFINSMQDNCRYHYNTYAGQPNNPFGMIEPSADEVYPLQNGAYVVPAFENYFYTAAWGFAQALDLPISTTAKTQMAAFFQWQAKGPVGVLGPQSSWWYINGAPYTFPVSMSGAPDFIGGTGPWIANFAAAYTNFATGYVDPGYAPLGTTEGVLALDIGITDPGVWHNLQPAISYAVRFAVPGASAAYARMTSASNFSTITNAQTLKPVWSVVPSGQTSSGGGTLTTPGPSFIWDSAPLVANSFIWDTYRGLGIPLSAVPSGGTNGTSVIRALIESGDNPNSEARVRYISTPTGFASGGDTSYTSPAGAINYEAYLDGASLGQATDTVGTGGGSDTTAPTMNGTISASAITASSFTLSWPAASDNVAVTGYEVSIDGGSNYVNVGNVLTTNKTGLTASTGYAIRVRAYDAANNKATPLSATVTTIAGGSTPAITVTVAPASIGVIVGASQQFSATLTGPSGVSQAVTWTVSGLASISTGGLATGPIGVYTVTARSVQDNTKTGTALFAVLAPGSASLPPDIGLNTLIVQGPVGIDPIIG